MSSAGPAFLAYCFAIPVRAFATTSVTASMTACAACRAGCRGRSFFDGAVLADAGLRRHFGVHGGPDIFQLGGGFRRRSGRHVLLVVAAGEDDERQVAIGFGGGLNFAGADDLQRCNFRQHGFDAIRILAAAVARSDLYRRGSETWRWNARGCAGRLSMSSPVPA